MSSRKDSICFILSRTQFARNLGAAARVMKNMGLSSLWLVAPRCEVGMEARAVAMKGAEVLDGAELFPSLEAASGRVDLLVGASGRFSPEKPNWTESRTFCRRILPRYLPARVGIAFGAEDNGLTKEEARLCRRLIEIPANPEYPVLNLAQAAGIMAYEIHMALRETPPEEPSSRQADPRHVAALLEAAESTLKTLGYPPQAPLPAVMKRLQKLAERARLEVEDVNLFRGLLRHLAG